MKWISYRQTQAHKKLLKLCEHPYDLRENQALSANGRLNYICRSRHFSLHYWAQRLDDAVLDALQSLSDECGLVEQFCAMKTGTVMNVIEGYDSENKQVLHTAVRDVFSDLPHNDEMSGLARGELEKLRQFLSDIDQLKICAADKKSIDTFIHIGIGGSDLGPRSVYEALKAYGKKERKLVFIANVDPDDAASVLQGRDLGRCVVCIVSKSGTTLETRNNEELVRKAFVERGLDPAKHFIAVTGKGSPMDNPERYLRCFYMFDSIGGRFSTTSMVGLVSLGFCLGYERVLAFLEGAHITDCEAEQRDIRKNQPLLLALIGLWNRSYLGYPSVAVIPYSQGLHRFAAHLQQCDMESNGKSVARNGTFVEYETGPLVWGEPGTNGQHAFFQLLHQGSDIVPVEFIGFIESQYGKDIVTEGTTSQQKLMANMLAQSVAFAQGKKDENPNTFFPGNRPSSLLVGERLTPWTMGALLALYEAKIVFQGFAWNINSFDQEGVQLGKIVANRFLNIMAGSDLDNGSQECEIVNCIIGKPKKM